MNLQFYHYNSNNLSFYGYKPDQYKENSLIEIDESIQEVSRQIFWDKFGVAPDVEMDQMLFAKPGELLCTSGLSSCVGLVAKAYEDKKHLLTGIAHYSIGMDLDEFFCEMLQEDVHRVDLCILGGYGMASRTNYQYLDIFEVLSAYSSHVDLKMELINPMKFKPIHEFTYEEEVDFDKAGLSYSIGVDEDANVLYFNDWNENL
jgi:hypothetical protein